MKRVGYLEGRSMSEAFNLMRENDLIWFFFVNNYLLGRDPPAFDLLYWNSDATRMPAAMQSYYLRNMYQRNVLKEPGGITLADVPIDLRQDRRPGLFPVDAGGPHRAVALDLCRDAAGVRAGALRAGRVRPYRRRDQSAVGQKIRLLDQRGAAGRRRRPGWKARTYHEGSWWNDWSAWIAGFGDGKVPARQPGGGGLSCNRRCAGIVCQSQAGIASGFIVV